MKKIIFLLLFFLRFNAFAQSYTPLLADQNEWQFTSCYFGCITDMYYTNGDTIVNGKTYQVLDGYHYINRNLLIREDVPEKKVYLTVTEPQYVEDILLYDFSLVEGDIMELRNPLTPFPANGGDFILDSIRTENDNDIDYKHFYFSPTETNTISSRNVKWIEGLGSLSLINAASGDPNISAVGELSCMFKDYEQFYSNLDSISGCNPLNLSVSEIIDSYPEIELFSQSERNRFLLTHADYVKDVAVFAINGVLQKEIPSQSYNELPLDLSELGTGIYILKVNLQNRKTETFKVVVE
jgi:hypothetical protein